MVAVFDESGLENALRLCSVAIPYKRLAIVGRCLISGLGVGIGQSSPRIEIGEPVIGVVTVLPSIRWVVTDIR